MANDIRIALKETGLLKVFEKLPPSHRNEYIKWIDDANKPVSRVNRIRKMIEMLRVKQSQTVKISSQGEVA